jgi:sec-independent protein translocase protein TatB
MFNLGMGELLLIFVVALIVLGPGRLPKLAQDLGKALREFRKAADDVKNQLTADESVRKPFQELRDAVTLTPEQLRQRDDERRLLEAHANQARSVAAAQPGAVAAAQPGAVAGAQPGAVAGAPSSTGSDAPPGVVHDAPAPVASPTEPKKPGPSE